MKAVTLLAVMALLAVHDVAATDAASVADQALKSARASFRNSKNHHFKDTRDFSEQRARTSKLPASQTKGRSTTIVKTQQGQTGVAEEDDITMDDQKPLIKLHPEVKATKTIELKGYAFNLGENEEGTVIVSIKKGASEPIYDNNLDELVRSSNNQALIDAIEANRYFDK